MAVPKYHVSCENPILISTKVRKILRAVHDPVPVTYVPGTVLTRNHPAEPNELIAEDVVEARAGYRQMPLHVTKLRITHQVIDCT
jgi:hypothetical protein